ncbi:CDP-alcohol phosphatidyltransferase family protein [Nocardioides sp. S-58]|uniref:CDP-alcohol phosphatidyltransferase family protein n=1 Tax=Nocardioides renjunii TaxID=3095075 RepID=A0ABU5KCY2_9ACTN|nr:MULTISPECIES: CDP-alcohol phosphatidyltransferase family protein [unclassified Nocardioides]MDZ5662835.1 CDP-alcohol phosphatidyltransferase family protein [Nocardioides sp. S-58]WQQ23383.1 CDP-alcohol phosphatidyltransferase family protein [Nocardioides sp. S-34]
MGGPGSVKAEPVADPENRYGVRDERLLTGATVITGVRTAASVVLAALAAHQDSLELLVAALVVYWVGDMLDGFYARVRDCETRIGAVLDVICDRFNAAAFYIGLAWLQPDLSPAIFVYLAEFMVVDFFLSIAFLAWPVRSPNYFFVIDRPIWLWNWSKPAKAVNSALFAVLLLVTGWMWVGLAIASALLVLKCVSLHRLVRIGLPVPGAVG